MVFVHSHLVVLAVDLVFIYFLSSLVSLKVYSTVEIVS